MSSGGPDRRLGSVLCWLDCSACDDIGLCVGGVDSWSGCGPGCGTGCGSGGGPRMCWWQMRRVC